MPALRAIFIALFLLFSFPAVAQDSGNSANDERVRNLFLELRCVVCQNQSIGDSDADVAKDLREIVKEQMAAGKTDAQIKQYLVDRYGEFILLKPVLGLHTLLLWLSPILFLLVGGFLIYRSKTGSSAPSTTVPLSPDEERELADLLKKS